MDLMVIRIVRAPHTLQKACLLYLAASLVPSYKGTNLGYDMMCESINSDQEEKEGDVLNGNCIINLNNFITNIDKFVVCKECSQEREI